MLFVQEPIIELVFILREITSDSEKTNKCRTFKVHEYKLWRQRGYGLILPKTFPAQGAFIVLGTVQPFHIQLFYCSKFYYVRCAT